MNQNHWIVIVNSIAGKDLASTFWPDISTLLVNADIQFECIFTQNKYHAVSIAINAISEGYRKIIAVGGDGTIHEIINAIFLQKEVSPSDILLGIIPIGTGNDFVKMYDISTNLKQAVDTIAAGRTTYTDIGTVTFMDNGVERSRFFANEAGFGLDAVVVRQYERICERTKRRDAGLYYRCLLTEFLLFRHHKVRVDVDGKTIYNGAILSGNVALGQFLGGGIKANPLALPDDGLFDITLVRQSSKWSVARHIKGYTNGQIYSLKQGLHARGTSVQIHSLVHKPLYLEMDGETMGTAPFSFTILPFALQLVVGPGFHSFDPTI